MRLGFGLGVTAPSVLARVSAVAEFTMTQLAKANRNYQRTSSTGGEQGKGSGTIPVQVNVTTAGPIFRRIRSQGDDSILQAAALVTNANAGAQTLQVPVDVRLGWFFVDLAPTANGPWVLGTTRVGMGGASLWTGQSQMSRSIGRTSGASGTIAGNGITVSAYGTVYATYADTRTVTSPAWAVPADGSNYDATAVAEFLRLKIEAEGCNWSVIGHSVGGSTINGWQPGNTHFNNLLPILAEEGGFEEWWSYLGGTDAGAGTTGAAYKTGLTNVFNELVNRNLLRGSNFRKYIAVAGTRLAGGDGTAAQVTALRVAGKEWAAENGGVYLEPHDITLLDDVHQDQAGGVTLGRHIFRATTSGDVGPTITGGSRTGTVITLPVQHASGATALVRAGNPASRFSVYPAGTVTGALALASTDGVTVTANAISLNLAADPGAGVAVDVYALRHPDPSGSTPQSNMVYDNRNPEGFAFGRHVQPTHVPVQVAAPGGTVVAPDAPTATATAGSGQNVIAYADGASNGGAPITARPLYRSTTANFTPGAGNLLQANPTYPFTDAGLTNGTPYYYKVGATNTAGTTYSGEVAATPSASANLLDTFTDTDGVALSAHTGESGHTWSTTNGTDAAIRSNRVAAATVPCNLLSSFVPANVMQSIVASFTALSTAAQNTLIRFRIQSDNTYYYAGKVNNGTNKWVIGYTINGTTNNAAISTADIPGTTGTTYSVRVEDGGVGGLIRLLINDTVVAQLTDNQAALNNKGRIGLRYSLAAAGTGVGMHVTSIRTESTVASAGALTVGTSSRKATMQPGDVVAPVSGSFADSLVAMTGAAYDAGFLDVSEDGSAIVVGVNGPGVLGDTTGTYSLVHDRAGYTRQVSGPFPSITTTQDYFPVTSTNAIARSANANLQPSRPAGTVDQVIAVAFFSVRDIPATSRSRFGLLASDGTSIPPEWRINTTTGNVSFRANNNSYSTTLGVAQVGKFQQAIVQMNMTNGHGTAVGDRVRGWLDGEPQVSQTMETVEKGLREIGVADGW
ncbi:hypothetical protein [Sphingomonas corticis]|uniref:Fibronectin type-III domain-containing protein n=1 Tax=Sphingomonas corticis TaxID=2722791 RepID=A0ABX1CUI8_9SPHN|nr:hypothetical protein [Sphingomonas corticis]NJR80471.1 hypothetical protein [Sphingomonas corticis]